MYPDGHVELRFGGTALSGNSKALDDFCRVVTDHMGTDNPVRFWLNQEFHKAEMIALRQGMLQWTEPAFVYIDCAELPMRPSGF